jgi:hypothetical protein
MRIGSWIGLALSSVLATPTGAAAQELFAVDVATDFLQSVHIEHAASSPIGAVAGGILSGLTWDVARDALYAVDAGDGSLYRIEPETGAGALLGLTGVSLLHGLAAHPQTGELYAIDSHSFLYRIDTDSAAATVVGGTGFSGLSGLEFDPVSGTLYASYASVGSNGFLVQLDSDTGLGSPVALTHRLTGIAFTQDGQLFGIDNGPSLGALSTLYAIDKNTGIWTPVGSTQSDNLLGLAVRLPRTAERYCVAGMNSVGAGALIDIDGSTSIADQNFQLQSSGLPTVQSGIFLLGTRPIQIPFGGGYRCVGGQLRRSPHQRSDSAGRVSWDVDVRSTPITTGSTWNFQYWYRDPRGPAPYNLSDAMRVDFRP